MKILRNILALILTLAPAVLYGQHYVGVRGGYGSGMGGIYPQVETKGYWGLYNAGISWKYFTEERYAGGVEADILFMQQGYRVYGNYGASPDTTTYYTRRVNSIMVPLFWHPHVYLFNQSVRVFLNLGITLSYNINQRYWWDSEITGPLESGKYRMTLTKDNYFGYGLCGGGGISYLFKRWEVFTEFRYYRGYADIMKNRNKYETNPMRSPLHGFQVSVGVFFRLGKKGIRSPQGRRVERYEEGDHDRTWLPLELIDDLPPDSDPGNGPGESTINEEPGDPGTVTDEQPAASPAREDSPPEGTSPAEQTEGTPAA